MYYMQDERQENFFVELIKYFVVAVIIVIPVRLWVAQPFVVSGESMEPTFDTGQYLIVDELTYNISDPQRGDVVIFRYPLNTSEFFIKRIIGLPGETLSIDSLGVYIVGANGSKTKISEPYLVNIGNGKAQTITLKAGEYFVMGDNRPDSSDSRFWGSVPRSDIVGRAIARLLPVSKISLLPGSLESFAKNAVNLPAATSTRSVPAI